MTITEFLERLPAERKPAIETLRNLVRKHLPPGYEERIGERYIAYEVPLSVYPDTYNKQPLMYAALGSQKGHMAIYLCHVAGLPELKRALEEGFKKAGKKLDMGAACVRFKQLSELPLDVVARAVAALPVKDYVAFARGLNSKEAKAARKEARAKPVKATAKKEATSPDRNGR